MRANRTELVFKMGKQLFKFATFKLNRLHQNITEAEHETDTGVENASNIKKSQLHRVHMPLKNEIEQFKELLKILPFDVLSKVITGFN